MLWEEMEKYTKLTGEDATHVPIMKIGAYLDGYEKGTEVLDRIRAEIEERKKNSGGEPNRDIAFNVCLKIIDKYKAEGSGE